MVESSQKGLFQVKIKYAQIFGHLDIWIKTHLQTRKKAGNHNESLLSAQSKLTRPWESQYEP